MLNVTLYTRKDCKLCDEVKEQLNELQSKYPHRLVEVDIDLDPALIANYGQIIPVIEVGPYRLKAPITPQNLQMNLGAAFDRKNQLEKLGDPEYQMRIKKGKNVNTGDRVSFWIAKPVSAFVELVYVVLCWSAISCADFDEDGRRIARQSHLPNL
ncbi:MAG: glutaredoxin family protein [Anaerolineales bacterium]|nr:glutaredoxin family protein [Anaerolineales bacterium]